MTTKENLENQLAFYCFLLLISLLVIFGLWREMSSIKSQLAVCEEDIKSQLAVCEEKLSQNQSEIWTFKIRCSNENEVLKLDYTNETKYKEDKLKYYLSEDCEVVE